MRDHVPSCDLVPVDSNEVEGNSLAGLGALDRRVVDLHPADPRAAALRQHRHLRASFRRPRPQRPGHDRARPADAEHAVDVQPQRTRSRAALRPRRRALQRRAQLLDPLARARRHDHQLGVRAATRRPRSPPGPDRSDRSWSPRPRPRERRAPPAPRRARASAASRRRRRRRPSGRGRSRSRPRPSCARSARVRARRRRSASARTGARAARSRARSRSRAPSPRAAGRCPCRSGRARSRSCRDRCGRRFRG